MNNVGDKNNQLQYKYIALACYSGGKLQLNMSLTWDILCNVCLMGGTYNKVLELLGCMYIYVIITETVILDVLL